MHIFTFLSTTKKKTQYKVSSASFHLFDVALYTTRLLAQYTALKRFYYKFTWVTLDLMLKMHRHTQNQMCFLYANEIDDICI